MRSPATLIDSKLEALIEETRRLLEPYVRTGGWKADPGSHVGPLQDALFEIYGSSSVSQRAKDEVSGPVVEAMKKRGRGRPTRHFRDRVIAAAASRIVKQVDPSGDHYKVSRNDATRDKGDKECAASIIQKALARLDQPMEEQEIAAIVLKTPYNAMGHTFRNNPPD